MRFVNVVLIGLIAVVGLHTLFLFTLVENPVDEETPMPEAPPPPAKPDRHFHHVEEGEDRDYFPLASNFTKEHFDIYGLYGAYCTIPVLLMVNVPNTGMDSVTDDLAAFCQDNQETCHFCCPGHYHFGAVEKLAVVRRPKGTSRHYRCSQLIFSARHPVRNVESGFYASRKHVKDGIPDPVVQDGEDPVAVLATKRCGPFDCETAESFQIMAREKFTLEEAISFSPSPFYVPNKMSLFLLEEEVKREKSANMPMLVDVALARLHEWTDFVVLEDRVPESMMLLTAKYKIPLLKFTMTRPKVEFTPLEESSELYKKIEEQNSADMRVFKEALEIFEENKQKILAWQHPREPMPFTCGEETCGDHFCKRLCTRTALFKN